MSQNYNNLFLWMIHSATQIHAHLLTKTVFKILQKHDKHKHMRRLTCLVFASLFILTPATACGPGREIRASSPVSCMECRVGYYRNETVSCIPCPQKSTTQFPGAVSVAECTLCLSDAVYVGWDAHNRHAVCRVCEAGLENLPGHRRTRCATPKWGTLHAYQHPNFHNIDYALLNMQINPENIQGLGKMQPNADFGHLFQITEDWSDVDPYKISLNTYRLNDGNLEIIRYNENKRPCDFIELWKTSFEDFQKPQLGTDYRKNSFCSQTTLQDSLYAHVLPMHTKRGDIEAFDLLLNNKQDEKTQIMRVDTGSARMQAALQYYDLRVFFTKKYLQFLRENINSLELAYMNCIKEEYENATPFDVIWEDLNIARNRYTSEARNEQCNAKNNEDVSEYSAKCFGPNLYDIVYTEAFCDAANTTRGKLDALLDNKTAELGPILETEFLEVSFDSVCQGHENLSLTIHGQPSPEHSSSILIPTGTRQVTAHVRSADGLCSAERNFTVAPQHVQRDFFHARHDECPVASLVDGADFSAVWEQVYRDSHVAPSIRENIQSVLRRYSAGLA